jgi:short subunit dehydrogenase-like uncharacterized protein
MSTRLNFIIFGATGYTGKIVVNEMALAAKLYKFSWGVAGRSVPKLREVLNSVSASNSKIFIRYKETHFCFDT